MLIPFEIFQAADMSQATLTSTPLDKRGKFRVGIQLGWTGTPTGAFTLQVSQDLTLWTDLPLVSAPAAAGSASSGLMDIETSFAYLRVIYTRTSGSGALTAKASIGG